MGEEALIPQYLELQAADDGKVWVAEIIDEDKSFGLKRIFLPQVQPGVYEMFDGAYQINGIHPGITPFKKEYCLINKGHMERRVPFGSIIEILPYLKKFENERKRRIEFQIRTILKDIAAEFNHEQVNEEINYMQEQLQDLETSEQLMATFAQLLKRKDAIIKSYQQKLKYFT